MWGESELASNFSVLDTINTGALPAWTTDMEDLNELVTSAFSSRLYQNPNPGNYKRKAAWYFPVDGCYAKAAHVSAVAGLKGYPHPGKIFAFGHLRFRTPYAKGGAVYWSYHVAAAYRVGGTVYILDPLVNRQGVVTLNDWLNAISNNPSSVRVRLCDKAAYSPSSPCVGGRGNGAYQGHMRNLLVSEYNHLLRIGLSPQNVLGP
jgi:hypothetical protein